MIAELFIVGEEEGLILLNRSAGRASELIALEVWLLDVEEVAPVERTVSHEFKTVPVELVRP